MITETFACYSLTGDISVVTTYDDGPSGEIDLATFDADGRDWTADVDRILAAYGYARTGEWHDDPSGDAVAPVWRE